MRGPDISPALGALVMRFGPMWWGLLHWFQDDPSIQRDLACRVAAQRAVGDMLRPERLSELSLRRFTHAICQAGTLCRPGGTPVAPDRISALSPGRLSELLEAGEMVATGNQVLDCAPRVCPRVLPGLEAVRLDELRGFIERLLGDGDTLALVRAASDGDAPVDAACATLLLAMHDPGRWAVWDDTRVRGLHRLALLLGGGAVRWPDAWDDYARFVAAARELREASGEVLPDLLAVDLLLARLGELGEPRAWKVAVGLTGSEPEAEAIARHCLEQGFAAIAPEMPDDVNISRLRRVRPGELVVMHLRGRVGAVGVVTRPYYEIDRRDVEPLDRRWWRRIGVQWLPGDRDYGSLLSGAQQRFSVIELERDVFWSIAEGYRKSPGYDRLIRPLRGAWLVRCDEERARRLAQLDKPLPLRDQWQVPVEGERPQSGDLAFLYRAGEGGAICGVARVLSGSSRHPRGPGDAVRLDLLYERLPDPPIDARRLDADPRMGESSDTDSWRPDEGTQVVRLSALQTAALRETLEVPAQRHFVLLVGGSRSPTVRPEAGYRFSHRVAGQPERLTDAINDGTARGLLYHGAAEHGFAGFGTVVELHEHEGAPDGESSLEVRLKVSRFTREAPASGVTPRLDAWRSGARAAPGRSDHARTVLEVAAHDFYRVVGAGMGATGEARGERSVEELAERCGVPAERLQQMERLLRERGQMIIYGPPGTGKTWLALRMADYLSEGDDARRQLVQFHPAYSYDDFIEGIRPQVVEDEAGGSDVIYPVVPGSFVSFCRRAGRDRDRTYVFVIDEINRANVAKVFGELMVALEYRDREVQLARTRAGEAEPERLTFAVPPNVLVLATMNTADHSTAIVDYALRRRFVFYPLFPDDRELVRPMFERWLQTNAPRATWVADLLDAINDRLSDEVGRDLLIGHTYFMVSNLSAERVREIWRFELRPLLEQYFAGMPEHLGQFDIDELIREARAGSDAATRSDGADAGLERLRAKRER